MTSSPDPGSTATEEASNRRSRPPLVALLGNPNTGKSSVFNRLTGLRQHIANYPGVTVEKKVGTTTLGDGADAMTVRIVDLPGSYSLSATSPDERVVIDVLAAEGGNERPDLLVCVLDATNLKRNLFLASQLAEFDLPLIIVLNQWDVVKRSGARIDIGLLQLRLGVPVVPTVASTGEGIQELRQAIQSALARGPRLKRISWPDPMTEISSMIRKAAEGHGHSLPDPEIQRILFDSHSAVEERLRLPSDASRALVQEAREKLRSRGFNPGSVEAVWHYEHIDRLVDGVIERGTVRTRHATESIDRLLMHKFWGSLILVAIMWVVFQSLYSWASPLMDLIDALTAWLQATVSPWFGGMPILQSLIVDGVIAGVGGVLIFVPQIAILFLFIGILEDTGYMARAAFLMDKLFGWCGLNGKSFIPLLSSYACAIPGIMAARSLEDPKARITTIMMAPLMSCSARLPVYVLMIGAFIEPVYGPWVSGWLLLAMHFVGILVSLPLAWFTNRVLLKTRTLPFLLEMPPYRIPSGRNLFIRTWGGAREFILRAGTVILAFSVVIWALLYFPRDPAVAARERAAFVAGQSIPPKEVEARLADEGSQQSVALLNRIQGAYVEQSYMGRMGKFLQPIFEPAGFDWKISIGVLASFPAREVIIATLGITYNLGSEVNEDSESLREIMAAQKWTSGPRAGTPIFTVPTVIAVMVFFALCLQCGSTLAVIVKELNWKWALAAFFGMTSMAWIASVLIYQIGTRMAA
ncbi:MAG: ferrous iron transport protein B [Planctomycetota bacterium]